MTIPFEIFQRQLAQFFDKAAAGEEMVITRDGRAVARLVPEHASEGPTVASNGAPPDPSAPKAKLPDRVLGSAKGLLRISDDFDAPLEEFREYME